MVGQALGRPSAWVKGISQLVCSASSHTRGKKLRLRWSAPFLTPPWTSDPYATRHTSQHSSSQISLPQAPTVNMFRILETLNSSPPAPLLHSCHHPIQALCFPGLDFVTSLLLPLSELSDTLKSCHNHLLNMASEVCFCLLAYLNFLTFF